MAGALPGAIPAPNLWRHPARYEVENRALDHAGRIDSALRRITAWTDATIVDVGCGSGFHLPVLAAEARSVVGVEPHAASAAAARRRTRDLPDVRVVQATAQSLPLADGSVDVALARWAYFFGPGCEPGLAEVARVVRRGGTAAVVDTDPSTSTWGRWFTLANPSHDARAVDAFFSRHGWATERLVTSFQFESRADLEAVAEIEFGAAAGQLVAGHRGTEVDVAVVIRVKRY